MLTAYYTGEDALKILKKIPFGRMIIKNTKMKHHQNIKGAIIY